MRFPKLFLSKARPLPQIFDRFEPHEADEDRIGCAMGHAPDEQSVVSPDAVEYTPIRVVANERGSCSGSGCEKRVNRLEVGTTFLLKLIIHMTLRRRDRWRENVMLSDSSYPSRVHIHEHFFRQLDFAPAKWVTHCARILRQNFRFFF